jgi:hypothetical protein
VGGSRRLSRQRKKEADKLVANEQKARGHHHDVAV